METALYFLAVIGPLIFFHELGHFLVAKWAGVRVERFSLGYPPRIFGFRKGDTDYCVSAVPLGGYVKMAGENPEEETAGRPDEFSSKSPGARAAIIAAGPLANYVLAFVLYVVIVMIGGDLQIKDNGLYVGTLREDWPGALAGLQPGDRMLQIDGVALEDFEALRDYVGPRAGVPIDITVLRGSDTLGYRLVPRASEELEAGDTRGMIGLSPEMEYRQVGALQAVQYGAAITWQNTLLVTGFFGKLITGRESPRNIGGPLFIATIAGEVANQGWRYLLGLMALLSINLVILNILPIPVLDGGQLLFLGIEKLRGGPLTLNQRIRVQQIGLAFLFVLIIFVTINDIVRVFS